MKRRLSREEAARARGVSLSTMDRWIRQGVVEVEHIMDGQRRRVVVLVDEDEEHVEGSGGGESEGDTQHITVELAVSQERVRGLEELVGLLQDQVALERSRYAELYGALRDGTLALPEARRSRPWWKFLKRD